MPLSLAPADRQRAVAALQRYAADALATPLGERAAGLLLAEIGPSVYNRTLADA